MLRQDVRRRREKELRNLKQEIGKKAEKKKLMEGIEKQMQKNLLLDIQLAEKEKLAREKKRLVEIMRAEDILPEEKAQIKEKEVVEGEKIEVEEEYNHSELEIDSEVRIPN